MRRMQLIPIVIGLGLGYLLSLSDPNAISSVPSAEYARTAKFRTEMKCQLKHRRKVSAIIRRFCPGEGKMALILPKSVAEALR